VALDEVKQNGRAPMQRDGMTIPMDPRQDRKQGISCLFRRGTLLAFTAYLVACGSTSSTGTDTGTAGASAGGSSGITGGPPADGSMCCPGSTGGTGASSGTTGSRAGGDDASSLDATTDSTGGDASIADDAPGMDEKGSSSDGGCLAGDPVIESHPIEGANHLDVCSPVSYGTNPPSSGNHYAIWAAYKTYTVPIPWGFLVHDLEHGAIVITYNCPDGCAAEVAEAQALIDSLPPDPVCGSGPPAHRAVIAPAPDIGVRFAASAWGWTLRACSFDRDTFAAFINAHYAQTYENLCADGEDPTGGDSGSPLCPGL
jgi:hypothetical protein